MPDKEIKPWIITVSYGPQCSMKFGAYSVEDPLDKIDPEDFLEIEEELWDNYGYTITGLNCENIDIDQEEDPEAWDEEYDRLYYEFKSDIDYDSEIDEYNEIDSLEVIYDERENA